MQKLPPFDKIGVTPVPDFVNASPQAGIAGSIVNGEIFNSLQDEMQNAVSGSGLAPTDSDYTQILQSLLLSGGLYVGNITYSAGSPETYSAALPGGATVPALKPGMRIVGLVPTASATVSPSLAVGGFTTGSAPAPIHKKNGSAPSIGDVSASLVGFRFDGAYWRIDGTAPSDLSSAATDSQIWHVGTAGGGGAALTTTLSPVPAHGASGYFIALSMPPGLVNAANATLAWEDASGAEITVPLVVNTSGSNAAGGEMPASTEAQIFYDGAHARIINPAISPASYVPPATYPSALIPRAWGKFDASSGTPVIQDSYNVSSISVISNGYYRINFTNPMPDASYVILLGCSTTPGDTAIGFNYVDAGPNPPTTTGFGLNSGYLTQAAVAQGLSNMSFCVFVHQIA